MILFINTVNADVLQAKLIDEAKQIIVAKKESKKKFNQAEDLLPFIDSAVRKSKLTAVAAVSGPGGYSSLRIGLVTANTLAWALHIPLVEISKEESETDLKLIAALCKMVNKRKTFHKRIELGRRVKSIKNFKPLLPKYSSDFNNSRISPHCH